jgi:hypothetical protein
MKAIFGSRTSCILLNGVLGKTFNCKRGVRQGDPLSPLLFVLAAGLLQTLMNKAKDMNLIQLPISLSYTSDFPIQQYADDRLIVMEGCPRQLFFLKSLLQSFATYTGLKVNYFKSMIVPINVAENKMKLLARTLGCSIVTMPFTYLGASFRDNQTYSGGFPPSHVKM